MALKIVDAIDEIHRQHVVHGICIRAIFCCILTVCGHRSPISNCRHCSIVNNPADRFRICWRAVRPMSPEQTGRMNRADRSPQRFLPLGVLFFRLLCGRLPFEDESPLAIVHAHIARPPPNASTHCAGIRAHLSDIIAKLFPKTRESRYQSAQGCAL